MGLIVVRLKLAKKSGSRSGVFDRYTLIRGDFKGVTGFSFDFSKRSCLGGDLNVGRAAETRGLRLDEELDDCSESESDSILASSEEID
jgi:hypothetical protein